MKNFWEHLRMYIFRGLLAIIPLLLCVLAIQLLYVLIDKKVMVFLSGFFKVRQIPGLGILMILFFLYFLGWGVSNIVGHQILKFIEKVSRKIPFIKVIYEVGKQFSQGLSVADQGKQAFQKAVLVKMDDNGPRAIGFVMNTMIDRNTNEEYLFVLIPTSPTPTSGFVMAVKSSQVIDPGWTVEECLKMVVSIGIVAPGEIRKV